MFYLSFKYRRPVFRPSPSRFVSTPRHFRDGIKKAGEMKLKLCARLDTDKHKLTTSSSEQMSTMFLQSHRHVKALRLFMLQLHVVCRLNFLFLSCLTAVLCSAWLQGHKTLGFDEENIRTFTNIETHSNCSHLFGSLVTFNCTTTVELVTLYPGDWAVVG